jgi:hypothetical protein
MWTATCIQAQKALREILPYLVVKAEQAECALAFSETVTGSRRITDEILAAREEWCKRLAALKRTHFTL